MSDNSQQIESLLRRHDHDRWTCSLFAPDTARPHILTLLAFNYEIARVREAVTEPAIGAVRLAWWRDAVDDLSRGIVQQHFVLEELAKIPSLNHAKLQTMIDARAREFDDPINATYGDFISYCRDTSGVLWDLCAAQADDTDTAANIGQAWAMIGILRSVMFQAQFRRMYLPLDLLAQHGIDKDRFFDVPTRVDLSPVVKYIAGQARYSILENLKSDGDKFTQSLGHLGLVYFARLQRAKYNLLDPGLQRPLAFKYLRLIFK